MENIEIRFSGLGGQGIILASYITGKAVTIYDKLFATQVQSYGPESRGGACSAQLTISTNIISYPIIINPAILLVMSQAAYNKYSGELKKGGLMLVEENMVEIENPRKDIIIKKIPASKLAKNSNKSATSLKSSM